MSNDERPIWKTQADQAFCLIRLDILACRMKPGAKLKINELCSRYDLSLGSIREALSRLSADGLVVAEPQKGFSVAPVSRGDLIDLTNARIEIESLCVDDAIEHGSQAWESNVLAAFHHLRHLPERSPDDGARLDDRWSTAHQSFHAALVSGCTNSWLLKVREMLFSQAERYRRLSVPLRVEERDVDAEHHEMLKAVLSHDKPRARALIAEHLRATTRIILDGLVSTEVIPVEHVMKRRKAS